MLHRAVFLVIILGYFGNLHAQALPRCSEFDTSHLTEDDYLAVIQPLYDAAAEPWGTDFASLVRQSARELGCEPENYYDEFLPIMRDGFESDIQPAQSISTQTPWSECADEEDCYQLYLESCDCGPNHKRQYCECVSYCGEGDSWVGGPTAQITDFWLLRPSDTLNELCYEHDRCYGRKCQNNSGLLCTFNTQDTGIIDCDIPVDDFCTGFGAIFNSIVDNIICMIIDLIRVTSHAVDCETDNSYCPDGDSCIADSEACEDPEYVWRPDSCFISRTIPWVIYTSEQCVTYFNEQQACQDWVAPRTLPGQPYDQPFGTVDCGGTCTYWNHDQAKVNDAGRVRC